MKKFLIVGIAAAALCGVPAFAADVPTKAPVYKAIDPGFSWTGWYGGVNVGVGISQTRGETDFVLGSFDRSGAGFAAGVQGGYNWQFDPRWVAGIEGDIGYLGIDRSFQNWDNTIAFGVKTDWYGTIRGRLGYTNGPSLFYVTGGVAFVNVKNNFDAVAGTHALKSETATGWTVGGGVETMLGGNWSAKAEYLYIDAGIQDVFNPALPLAGGHFDNRFHVFKFGLNYKFGGPGMAVRAMPSYNWTGFYVGVNAGAGLSQDHVDTGAFLGSVDIAGSGFTGGVQAGYNWQFNPNWVIGIEGDIGYLGIDRSFQSWNANVASGVKTDWYGTIRGRLGYSTGPALLYVTGGAAFVNVKNNFDTIAAPAFASKSETATGWTVGGGIEAALARNWTAKTEYLYIDAGSQDVFNPTIGGGSTAHFDNRFHVFKFGLNYKFGGPVSARY